MVNTFLQAKKAIVESGELAALTWLDYKSAGEEILTAFGAGRLVMDLRPDDFGRLRKTMAAKWGAQRLSKTIQFIRCVFKYAYDAEMIDRPIRFGPDFKRPSKGAHRVSKGTRYAGVSQLRGKLRIISTSGPLRSLARRKTHRHRKKRSESL